MANSKFKKNKSKQQPEGKVRSSQMLGIYGPGALVDLLDHAVIINGLSGWRYGSNTGDHSIVEPRLRDRVAYRLKKSLDQNLDPAESAFKRPPAGEDENPRTDHGVSATLFPSWFVCQDPDCRGLVRHSGLDRKGDRFYHHCGSMCVPVRFVQACKAGHIDDLYWIGVAHPEGKCQRPELALYEGKTGDFSEVRVKCKNCGQSRQLQDLKLPEMQPRCNGRRPWLGYGSDEPCEHKASLIVRTASNAYFSQIDSALSIPETENTLYEGVQAAWSVLANVTAELLGPFRQIKLVQDNVGHFSDEEILETVEMIKAGEKPASPPIRVSEFSRLISEPLETPGQIAPAGAHFFARKANLTDLPDTLDRVVLAHKLREVRVQVGFTRLDYPPPSFSGEANLGIRSAPLSLAESWLPAVEVFGEGVLVALNEERVRQWERREAVIARSLQLQRAHEARYDDPESAPPFPGARFYLLHSLSHLLLHAISVECGYSASAIRERIYCAPATDDVPMAGILLSTATPGTEGTLGGLIEQGRHIQHHLAHALRLGRLCSNDPVCAHHQPGGQEGTVDGAACHGCLYVAESSCEFFNRYLDRAFVVPILGASAELAYFPSPEAI